MGKSLSGGGRVSLGKAKQHFFKNLDLNAVITPADDAAGSFTGGAGWGCSLPSLPPTP
jgi:hypothetical protein